MDDKQWEEHVAAAQRDVGNLSKRSARPIQRGGVAGAVIGAFIAALLAFSPTRLAEPVASQQDDALTNLLFFVLLGPLTAALSAIIGAVVVETLMRLKRDN